MLLFDPPADQARGDALVRCWQILLQKDFARTISTQRLYSMIGSSSLLGDEADGRELAD
jgi:hypothetical protein